MSDSSQAARSPGRWMLELPTREADAGRQLPLVAGVVANLAGDRDMGAIATRESLFVSPGKLDEAVAEIQPRVELTIENPLSGGQQARLAVSFTRLADFEPTGLIERVEPLRKLRASLEAEGLSAQDRKTLSAALHDLVSSILHAPKFQSLEAAWRGCAWLLSLLPKDGSAGLELFSARLDELRHDFEHATAVEKFSLARAMSHGYRDRRRSPWAFMACGYDFGRTAEDTQTLQVLAFLGSHYHCPVLAGPKADVLGIESFNDLPKLAGLDRTQQSPDWIKWRSLREADETRFAVLAAPRILAREPYRDDDNEQDAWTYCEDVPATGGDPRRLPQEHYLWLSGGFAVAAAMITAQVEGGWLADETGAASRAIDAPATHGFLKNVQSGDLHGALESEIDSRVATQLRSGGISAIEPGESAGELRVGRAPTLGKPARFHDRQASVGAAAAASLQAVASGARFMQHLLVLCRDWLYRDRIPVGECGAALEQWVAAALADTASRLESARVQVATAREEPGRFALVATLEPRLDGGQATAPIQFQAYVPEII